MAKVEMKKEWVQTCFESKFLKMYDLKPNNTRSYYDASRRNKEDLVALKTKEDYQTLLADAVSCVVVLHINGEERLLLTYEYRYAAGQLLLSVPAGLIDPQDKESDEPYKNTAIREMFEETGITIKDTDEVTIISPFLFSTPGMSDESNAIVRLDVTLDDLSCLTSDHTEGGEIIEGFDLLTKEDAKQIIKNGRDKYGIYYSVYTWMALTCFVHDIKEL